MARRDPLGFFLEAARRYGDIVCMQFGLRRVYLLSHPDHVRHVLQDNHRAYLKGPSAARARPLFGDSLTTTDGEHWRRQRRLMRPAFQPKQFGRFVPIVVEATAEMLDRWRRTAERGESLDLLREMRMLTRAIILQILFGDVAAVEARALGESLDLALEHEDRRLWSPFGWLELPTPGQQRFRQALRTVDAFISSMIGRARRECASPGTLLSALMEARDTESGAPMHDAELHEELKALLVAGHATTASALAWTWYAMHEAPQARQRLLDELRVGLDGRAPGGDDLASLEYTRMLLEEVLRLYPPTWVTARTPLVDDEVGGYRIAAGSIVMLSPFVTHRHPRFWEDPNRFDPDRFTPQRSVKRPPFAYFPFGGGPRSCIGAGLALMEMQLVVAMVAQRYELTSAPGPPVGLAPGLTLRPHPGLPMIPRPY